jgi:hypothetical protein
VGGVRRIILTTGYDIGEVSDTRVFSLMHMTISKTSQTSGIEQATLKLIWLLVANQGKSVTERRDVTCEAHVEVVRANLIISKGGVVSCLMWRVEANDDVRTS